VDTCPECGGPLNEYEEVVVKQQIEIVKKPFIVKEYRHHIYTCSSCQKSHTATEREESLSGLFSVGLIALVAYLKGRCHVSFSGLKSFFQEVLGIVVSNGFLAKQVKKASMVLKDGYKGLVERLKGEKQLHRDKSGRKEKGKRRWIWAYRAEK
jgi:hypothetical protein